MARRRLARTAPRPDLTPAQILEWADEFMAKNGRWPTRGDGQVGLTPNTWSGLDGSLKEGRRGLKPGSSLAKLLLEHRGRRHSKLLPPLTNDLILSWADAHHARTGDWPTQDSGPIVDAPGETWSGINCALHEGGRTLPGGSSIPQLLEAHRGVRNHCHLTPLTTGQILTWADAHHARTGNWPRQDTGPVTDAPGEGWGALDQALLVGCRGLPGGSSLARLLAAERGIRNPAAVPRLEPWRILAWADTYFKRTGRWPTATSGPIDGTAGETWSAVDSALWAGARGLPGDDSLARFLARRRGKRNPAALPPLTMEQLLAWMHAHHRRTAAWPTAKSGPIPEAAGETWRAVNRALTVGRRGLSGGSSLSQVVSESLDRNPLSR
jgi:hypothetical protein